MKMMNRTIIKHISAISIIAFFMLLAWLLFVYVFFNNELKRNIYPIIDESKQTLAEILNKNFSSEKAGKFISEFEKNEYVSYVTIKNNQNEINSKKINSLILDSLKLTYPIKYENKTVGRIEIWPSYELFSKILSSAVNILIFSFSIIVLIGAFVFFIYVYIRKYIFVPYKQIKTMINDIALDKRLSVDETIKAGVWNNIFFDLKKLHNKVFDINTTMNLLFSATGTISSDLELVNSVHVIFNVVHKRIKESICVLFVPDESGQLKVFAKNGLLNNDVMFIPESADNYIWTTYKQIKNIIVNDTNKITKENLGGLYDDNIRAFMSIPLIDENKNCIGVFVVISKIENSFNEDNIDIINSVSQYLVALINRIKDYQEIKETNRKLEIEIETVSKGIMETNDILIKKVKDMNNIYSVANYVSTKKDISDCMEYISLKVKEILGVEKFGIFKYNKKNNSLSSVKGSFDLNYCLKFVDKKDTIYNNVLNTGKAVVLNKDSKTNDFLKDLKIDELKINSAVFVPVMKEHDVVALVAALNKADSDFVRSDIKILEHISVIIYDIIERTNLYNKIKANIKMGEANGNS